MMMLLEFLERHRALHLFRLSRLKCALRLKLILSLMWIVQELPWYGTVY